MKQFSKEDFEKNIGKEGMLSHDQDLKFMGAHEICKMVQNDCLVNSMPEMDKYIDGLFQQLSKDVTQEVKGNAVTCMSKISAKLTAEQIEKIVKILIKQITSTSEEIKDIRDVFVMCLKNIIQQVPHDFHDKIKIVISESIRGIQEAKKQKEINVEQELIEIITHMFRKWGATYNDVGYKVIIDLLKQNIIGDKIDDNLRKKSCISLGVVAVMLNVKEVETLVQDLTNKHLEKQQQQQLDVQEQQRQKAISQALNALSKSVSSKMSKKIPSQIDLLKRGFDKWGLQDHVEDFDFVGVVCDLYESYLSTIEHLMKGCSHTDFTKEQKLDLIEISVNLMTMDPNRNCSIEDQDEEEEMGSDDEDSDDSDYSDEDQDDQSWRVRKSAMLLLEQIILTDKNLLDNIYHATISPQVDNNAKNMIKRLRERNQSVRQTIIKVLTSFINQIMVKEHKISMANEHDDFGISEELTLQRVTSKLTQFQLKDVIQPILKEIIQIYKDKRSNGQIKLQLFKMIENLSFSSGKQILEQQVTWSTTFSLLFDILKDKHSNTDIKVSCLISLRRILKFRGNADLKHIKNDIILIINLVESSLIVSDQYRINAESLKLISGIFRIIQECFNSEITNFTGPINKLLPHIISTLKQTDVDQEIKHAVISVASGLLVHIGNQIQNTQLDDIFESLQKKLKSENKNRITILKLYKKIPTNLSQKLSKKSFGTLNSTVESLAAYLKKEDRSERLATLDALNKLFLILGKQIDQKISVQIIEQSLHMIKPKDQKETDPAIACAVLSIYKQIITIFPKQVSVYNNILEAILFLTQSSIFQTNKYDVLYDVFQQMAQQKIINIESTFKQLLNSHHDAVISSSRALSSLILVAPNSDQLVLKIAKDHALKHHGSDEGLALTQRQIALLALCEVGKKKNLTQNKDIFEGVLSLIVNQKEDLDKIRKFASIALGGIALSNIDFALPKVIDFINHGNNPYLMLNTVKEIIQNSAQINESSLVQIIEFLFTQAAQDTQVKQQDLKNIISECIGKIALYKLSLVKSHILKSLKSQSENLRYTAAASFKFFFTETGRQNNSEGDLHEVLKALIGILNDKCVKVKESIIKSLNSIAYNTPAIIDEEIKVSMFEDLKSSFSHFDIVETDLGAFKDKKDKGAPLRTAAFQFLQNCLPFKNTHEFYDGIIQVCIENMGKESEAEIKILRIQILLKIAQNVPTTTIPYIMKIQAAIVSVIKVFANDKPIPDSNMDLVRTSLRVFHTFDKSLGDSCPVDFTNFLAKLKVQNNKKFGVIFDSFE